MCQAVSFFRTNIQWKKKERHTKGKYLVCEAVSCKPGWTLSKTVSCTSVPRRRTRFKSTVWLFGLNLTAGKEQRASDSLHNCQSVCVSGCRMQQSRSGGVAYQTVPRVCLHQSLPWSESDPTSVRQGILKWFAMIKCVKTELKSTFHENIVLPRARQFPGNEKSRYFCLLWSSEGSVRLFPPPPTPLTCVWITSLICGTSHCSAILMLYLPTRGRYNDAAALSERGM